MNANHKRAGAGDRMKDFKKAALELAIKKLFSEKHFSICALDGIGKMLGVNPEHSDLYPFLRGLHCVDYRDMPPEIIDSLQQKVIECLRPRFNASAITFALTAEGNDFTPVEDRYIEKH